MKIKYLLPAILLFTLGLNNIFAQYTIEWSIPFSVYRLIYNFTVDTDTPEVYVHVVIPESIIDQYLQYWQNKGINPFNYRDFFYPRVYFVKVEPPGAAGAPTLSYYFVPDSVTCLSTYNYYCNNFTVYLTNVPAGTHHIVVYMPAFFWEDFEDNTINARACNVGECIDGEWCVAYLSGALCASIASGGTDPTPKQRLYIDLTSSAQSMLLSKNIDLPITEYMPIILEYELHRASYAFEAIIVEFELTDGSTVAVKYGRWSPPGINICANFVLTPKTDVLKDLLVYCDIPIDRVAKISKIYVGTEQDDIWVDNIKLVPGFLYV